MELFTEENSNIRYGIKVSVRSLVEFVLRSGDIDDRFGGPSVSAMQEGSRMHRLIQGKQGGEYRAEVPLRYDYVTEKYVLRIEGRADGIINDDFGDDNDPDSRQLSINALFSDGKAVTIDEIKCVRKRLSKIRRPDPVHLAQAKVYAYIYLVQNELNFIRVRMTYCNPEKEDVKFFFEEYTDVEIKRWFDELIDAYRKFTDLQIEHYEKRQESIETIEFPFEYRGEQKQLTENVAQTIREKKKLFMEAPTGVGKTITTLYPSVKSMGGQLTEKVFYLTAKTITRTVADNAVGQMRDAGLIAKSVVLTAKEKICLSAKKECNPVDCPYARGHYDRINDAVYDTICSADRFDRDSVQEAARKHNVCPFELSLDLTWFADIIICDYNYLFDPHAYLRRFFAEGSGSDFVFLIDEAHNLLDRGRDMYSAELTIAQFGKLKYRLDEYLSGRASTEVAAFRRGRRKKDAELVEFIEKIARALDNCIKTMAAMAEKTEKFRLLENVNTLAGQVEGLNSAIGHYFSEEDNPPLRKDILELYFETCHFMLIYEKLDENYRMFAEVKEDNTFMVKLLCVDPSENLAECMTRGRASVLFSATFLPLPYYKKLLGGAEEDSEIYAGSPFDPSHLGIFIDRDVTSLYTKRTEDMYIRIADRIADVINTKRGNYMVFFPSYTFMETVSVFFEERHYNGRMMKLMKQDSRMNEDMREEFLEVFRDTDERKSVVGFCVLGGIFSEGIDLQGDALIGSIIIGTGLPMLGVEKEIIREFFAENGFDYAYRFPGMNRVLQAAGRVIRTETDTGVVVLLDERYVDNSYKNLFPREWTRYAVVTGEALPGAIGEFWYSQE